MLTASGRSMLLRYLQDSLDMYMAGPGGVVSGLEKTFLEACLGTGDKAIYTQIPWVKVEESTSLRASQAPGRQTSPRTAQTNGSFVASPVPSPLNGEDDPAYSASSIVLQRPRRKSFTKISEQVRDVTVQPRFQRKDNENGEDLLCPSMRTFAQSPYSRA